MRVIVVGAGEVTRELLGRLGKAWEVCVVDPSEAALAELRRERSVEVLTGDGSSRVVLEQAGLDDADGVIANTLDDDRNIEICRVALAAGVPRVAAVADKASRLSDYSELGIPALSPSRLAARQLEPHLELSRVTSKAFAQGKVEASEFRVTPNSPVRGMSVEELNGAGRTVAAILRDGNVLIPNGAKGITLDNDDLVTVVGSATELPGLIRGFTEGRARFPLDHGKRVAVVLASESDMGKAYAEAITITRYSNASSMLVIHPAGEDGEGIPAEVRSLLEGATLAAEGVEVERRASASPRKELKELPERESVGVIVVSAPKSDSRFGYLGANGPLKIARDTDTPVMFARGRHSYERIVVAARRSPSGEAAARAAIDIAELSGAELVALAVTEPAFVAGPDALEEAREAIRWVREQAALQGVDVRGESGEGNPIQPFLDLTKDASLLVLGSSESTFPFASRLANRLVHRSRASVLVVPALA